MLLATAETTRLYRQNSSFMEDQDITLKLPKHAAPPLEGVLNSQIQNLFAVGAGAVAD